jgi:hypothetical protein
MGNDGRVFRASSTLPHAAADGSVVVSALLCGFILRGSRLIFKTPLADNCGQLKCGRKRSNNVYYFNPVIIGGREAGSISLLLNL